LHAVAGAFVIGIDAAKDLIKVARRKSLPFDPNNGIVLFPEYLYFLFCNHLLKKLN